MSPESRASSRHRWRFAAAVVTSSVGWLLFSLAASVQGYLTEIMTGYDDAGAFMPWLGWQTPRWMPFMVLTPAILWLAHRVPFGRRRVGRALLVHGPASLATALLHATIATPFYRLIWPETIGAQPFPDMFLVQLDTFLAETVLVYWAIVGVWHAFCFYDRLQAEALQAATLEGQLARARLNALEAQLQPHFLFNTLHAVGVLVRRDPDAASRMIRKLGDLLRASLANSEEQEISLREELAFVAAYLEIEGERFCDRLRVEWDVDRSLSETRVPSLLLQPLVDNAIKHGISKRAGEGVVRIQARQANGAVELSVEDEGPGRNPDANAGAASSLEVEGGTEGLESLAEPSAGLGLRAVRERLDALYGSEATLEFRSDELSTTAIVRLPRDRTRHGSRGARLQGTFSIQS